MAPLICPPGSRWIENLYPHKASSCQVHGWHASRKKGFAVQTKRHACFATLDWSQMLESFNQIGVLTCFILFQGRDQLINPCKPCVRRVAFAVRVLFGSIGARMCRMCGTRQVDMRLHSLRARGCLWLSERSFSSNHLVRVVVLSICKGHPVDSQMPFCPDFRQRLKPKNS